VVREEETVNDFNIVLPVGTHGIFKAARFYNTKASEKDRTFVIAGGPGREPTPGSRKITGHWLDGMKDTIDSYSLEAVIINGKRIKQIVKGDPLPEPPAPEPVAVDDHEPQKPVRRKR
jgi:hypothetical protein